MRLAYLVDLCQYRRNTPSALGRDGDSGQTPEPDDRHFYSVSATEAQFQAQYPHTKHLVNIFLCVMEF